MQNVLLLQNPHMEKRFENVS